MTKLHTATPPHCKEWFSEHQNNDNLLGDVMTHVEHKHRYAYLGERLQGTPLLAPEPTAIIQLILGYYSLSYARVRHTSGFIFNLQTMIGVQRSMNRANGYSRSFQNLLCKQNREM